MFVTLDLQDSVCLYELEQRHFTGNDFPSLINFLAALLKQLCDHFYHRNYRDDPDKKKNCNIWRLDSLKKQLICSQVFPSLPCLRCEDFLFSTVVKDKLIYLLARLIPPCPPWWVLLGQEEHSAWKLPRLLSRRQLWWSLKIEHV